MNKFAWVVFSFSLILSSQALASSLDVEPPRFDIDREIAKQQAVTSNLSKSLYEPRAQRIARQTRSNGSQSDLKVQLIPVKR